VAELFESYSQHGEDVVLWRALGHRPDVVYVDVGAFHHTNDSVTRALYERGWRGVNIEPNAELVALFERERPQDVNVVAAVGDHEGTILLRRGREPGWSTTVEGPGVEAVVDPDSEALEVPLRRLDSILAEAGIDRVDVVKIDVEGAEVAVVRGMLDGGVRPTVCVVEGVSPALGRGPGDEAVQLLVDAGYTHCMFDGINHWLTLDEELVPALSVPANPLDGFVRIMPKGAEVAVVVDPESGEPVRITRIHPGDLPSLVDDLAAHLSPEQLVERLFVHVLGRGIDAGGAETWIEEARSGADPLALGQRLALHAEAQERPLDVRLCIAADLERLRIHHAGGPSSVVEPPS
jgi:FkbM family methyltransferase